ncbi:MAG: leucyl/phenylalanyl-tRNA--protein transferase [Pseudomonas sp.]|jgi:leucyl/phenylalanyl-tRNA--protein transferase|nr:leucyl/phenylalanyl-tRNA--protein transferase [Pseudomonas sp.]MDY0413782.1 leucyl/phenylalanyl-tRNA--protein transferase [Pseudomonas sp.]NLO53870.1 leucyl/phenylalanyl-tRNA--protein transferase [Gammaproteobacteria bacterium]
MLTWLNRASLTFPALTQALREPNGLLAAGGDLSSARLLAAYRHGCFPWYQDGQPILWWSPDPRTVLLPDHLHISRSLRKVLRSDQFTVTFDRNFTQVIHACAQPRENENGTWITSEIQAAYFTLHRQGYAHSVEVWQGPELVGGLYGIAIGQLFFGESMFSRSSNASKVGFVSLVSALKDAGFVLIDCQMPTTHLNSLGAHNISRADFAEYLTRHLDTATTMQWSQAAITTSTLAL